MAEWDDDDDDEDDAWDDEADDGPTLSAAEYPDPADVGGPADDDDDTAACPFCGRAVYADADVCPGCRNFLGGADEPVGRRPRWVAVGLALVALATAAACACSMW